jgi:hypothetical protein
VSPDPLAILETELLRLGLSSAGIREQLTIYIRELERWNKKLNLTSLAGPELIRRLVSEPAWIGQQLQMSGVLADIGSGNGSPGVPLYLTSRLSKVQPGRGPLEASGFFASTSHSCLILMESLSIEAGRRVGRFGSSGRLDFDAGSPSIFSVA